MLSTTSTAPSIPVNTDRTLDVQTPSTVDARNETNAYAFHLATYAMDSATTAHGIALAADGLSAVTKDLIDAANDLAEVAIDLANDTTPNGDTSRKPHVNHVHSTPENQVDSRLHDDRTLADRAHDLAYSAVRIADTLCDLRTDAPELASATYPVDAQALGIANFAIDLIDLAEQTNGLAPTGPEANNGHNTTDDVIAAVAHARKSLDSWYHQNAQPGRSHPRTFTLTAPSCHGSDANAEVHPR